MLCTVLVFLHVCSVWALILIDGLHDKNTVGLTRHVCGGNDNRRIKQLIKSHASTFFLSITPIIWFPILQPLLCGYFLDMEIRKNCKPQV